MINLPCPSWIITNQGLTPLYRLDISCLGAIINHDFRSTSKEDNMDIIKTIGPSGQISLGKKFAGQTVMLSEVDTGVWLVKLGRFIPENENGFTPGRFNAILMKPLTGQKKTLPVRATLSSWNPGANNVRQHSHPGTPGFE
jgi:hypothetical protein